MDAHRSTYTETTLRDAAIVMAPERLGAMHQNRISFVRSLIRKMASQEWQVNKHEWQLCPRGFGHVIYKLATQNTFIIWLSSAMKLPMKSVMTESLQRNGT